MAAFRGCHPARERTPQYVGFGRLILQSRAIPRGDTGPRAGPGSPLDRSPRQRLFRGPDYYFCQNFYFPARELSFSSPFRGRSGGGRPRQGAVPRTPQSPPPGLPPFRVEEKTRAPTDDLRSQATDAPLYSLTGSLSNPRASSTNWVLRSKYPNSIPTG